MAKNDIVKREVGERVEVAAYFEAETVKALEDGVFEAIVTTNEPDRHNEVIETEGIDTENWEKNSPTVLYGHDYFDRLPIGKGISLTRYKNKLKSKFQLAVSEYPFAATIAALIKGGYLTAVSIGGIVKEWSEDYRTIVKMEMVEFSVVPVPANRSAVITSKAFEDATGKTLSQVKKEFHEFVHSFMLDKLKSMGDDEVSQSIQALKTLLATLEESASARSSAGDVTPKSRILKLRIKESAVAINQESERIIKIIKRKR